MYALAEDYEKAFVGNRLMKRMSEIKSRSVVDILGPQGIQSEPQLLNITGPGGIEDYCGGDDPYASCYRGESIKGKEKNKYFREQI